MNDLMRKNIFKCLSEWDGSPPTRYQVADILDPEHRGRFYELMEDMETEGIIVHTKHDGWVIPWQGAYVTGKLQRNPRGFAFVLAKGDDDDVFIPANSMKGAMHGDLVVASLAGRNARSKKQEGIIQKVLQRANETVVGTFERSENGGYVKADNKRIGIDVYIPYEYTNDAKNGYKVVATIYKWPDGRRGPVGEITEILGQADDVGVDILSIARSLGLPDSFPADVLAMADKVPAVLSEGAFNGRHDLRDRVVFTIDGADAKDLDDAISIRDIDNGCYELGVHIADVSHYVTLGSALDKEAYDRATSVYLLDRVIPMLPEALSNGVCSLSGGVNRLTLSAFMSIDQRGHVYDYNVEQSVIKSAARLTYSEVNDYLEDNKKSAGIAKVSKSLDKMQKLAAILSKKRKKRGSLDLDIDEAHITLDKQGIPIQIAPHSRGESHRMIEEFMLCANETVAAWLDVMNMPAIYRIHEAPKTEKMTALNAFVSAFNVSIKGAATGVHPKSLQKVLNDVKDTPQENIISRLMLRSLQKAKYSPTNGGHFGLSTEDYCHFTSPIRRYPDLFVHRTITNILTAKNLGWIEGAENRAAQVADHCSDREVRATEAEREVEDLKMTEFMQNHIGEEFEALISGVTAFGLFVELKNLVEGLVHISELDDDYYDYDEKNHQLIGSRRRKLYRLGDAIKVKCVKASLAERKMDFQIV